MDDRDVVAAIAAEDPAGIAVAYDRYAAALYGYCQWMLQQPANAAEALRDTFVVAAATLGDLPDAPKLRPWLYAVARKECQRQLRTTRVVREAEADPADAADQLADAADQPTDAGHDLQQADLTALISAILAGLKPREREVIELCLRHDLYDADLAIALGVSWSRAHALASCARDRLEKDLGVLLAARTEREACPALDTLLADWDGQLTEQTRDLVGRHIEQCEACMGHGRGSLRPAAVSALLPRAALPPELREQVLALCSRGAPDAMAYRRRVVRRAESVWPARFSQAIRLVSWHGIRCNPGAATAAAVVVVWAVATVSVTLLVFAGSHVAGALVARPNGSSATTRPAATASPTGSPSRTRHRRRHAVLPPPVVPSPSPTRQAIPSPSQPQSPTPSQPQSPTPSKSPSPTPSKSPSPSRSPSPTPSRTPSPSRSPSPSATVH
jgi:RNA polymerase sigma factor (sigma-70 family)